MIHRFGPPGPPADRLLAALARRGHAVRAEAPPAAAGDRGADAATLVLTAAADLDAMALAALLAGWRKAAGARVLVLSALGAHPDARAPRLRRLWALEEQARGAGMPVLTLRLAPLVGPASPLWLRLRSRPALPRAMRGLVQPVAEADVVETLERALSGRAVWEGWYELAGPEAFTLAELVELAASAGPPPPAGAGEWEPALAELAEHRLAEAAPWLAHFGLAARPLADQVGAWAA